MGEILINTEGLIKTFGKFVAIDELNLTFESGIITSIIGPNGAGKTTAINLLTGALYPDQGKVFFRGEDITFLQPDQRVRRGIARSFQVMDIFPMLTVLENVQLPLLARFRKTRKWFFPVPYYGDILDEAEIILNYLGLWNKKDVTAGELSHGDQRLLEMGMAIASKPEICFLDEPSSGMNPLERAKVLELIRSLAEEGSTTFVIVEHDLDVIFSLSDRIIVMNKGSVLAEGEPDEIRKNKEVIEIYLGEEI
ncbi:MAG: ABC transporter ATP-binding protein [Deltaproteobacteria bacterium]|nr:ABC transporter ATP-binding protein [Deltaproteobacteria bacterium]MBW1930334.1 ABC transporter ATP-binding protein [Deltaproteobacteria bacterium]MBW2025889.1 ABC transporter ATP-binding protein [Deltaproteobacteria bacterium]MBW2125260.1 ABC transporter ATP-binding protein [Deltaproteobacteria bacterium]